jgi:hypothetical protein
LRTAQVMKSGILCRVEGPFTFADQIKARLSALACPPTAGLADARQLC